MGTFESRVGGHITLCFTVDIDSEEPLKQGSKGFGLSISKGVLVKVKKKEKKLVNKINFYGFKEKADVVLYETVLEILSRDLLSINEYSWDFDITLELPPQQGFGLSAAGACASAIAIQRALGTPELEIFPRAIKTAHLVERKISGGLGDIAAISVGGVERRIKPGFPKPIGPGIVESWHCNFPVILVWMNNLGTHTSSYIDSKKWQSQISSAGNNCMKNISSIPWDDSSWEMILQESLKFCDDSGLIREQNRMKLLEKMETVEIENIFGDRVVVRLCMLGLSAIILPKICSSTKSKDWLSKVSNYLEKRGLEYSICDVSHSPLSL